MSNFPNWLEKTPTWIWWSFFPGFGGLAISYAGYKSSTQAWIAVGLGLTAFAWITSSSGLAAWIWLAQIAIAFSLRQQFLLKTYPNNLPAPNDPDLVRLVAKTRNKIDINSCSKNELVNTLGLPIVYANDIESLRNEGFVFTHSEELSEIIGIPESKVSAIAPLITFYYDHRKDSGISWRRLNTLVLQEFIDCGLEPEVAKKIFEERQRRGDYKSLIDVKRRTGLPLSSYQLLM
ncbi:helix-hairpin-helix domain-containing protein [Kovacikia minuta CCNUW1]|uniref:helix-hairpin-helix domain-containing protein n=1 Tax=Kovacikia minuta TaxID=2931930 RepID=UPI001CC911BF|nr:helix-hairpin-helix domain-containing protein [Kovacikia minuta]UBF25740.1 helix-hairpin-helix domain-containing protein [Kovacikia minuta CCNUW1]